MPVCLNICDKEPGVGKNIVSHQSLVKGTHMYKKEAAGEIVADSACESNYYEAEFGNGFVGAIFDSYCKHHNLVLRPDDVWLAIMTQFSLYVNCHAEELRGHFVAHEGKIAIEAYGDGSLYNADWPRMMNDLTLKCTEYLKDPEIRGWILPNFSTTRDKDVTIHSIVMMSALQSYFTWRCYLECGIPRLTLLGEIEDWQKIRDRVDRLDRYDLADKEMSQWKALLIPVLDEFVAAFKDPENANLDFWKRICHYIPGGSGPSYISGWVTVFCIFGAKGWIRDTSPHRFPPGTLWPWRETGQVPTGMVSVPVEINDNGTELAAKMFAGHLAYTSPSENTVQPSPEWTLALIDEGNVAENAKRMW